MSYKGLILDFGGAVTTDFYGALSAFSVREGLDAGAFVRVLRETAEGREALAAGECGQMSQRAYEQGIGRLLGLDDHGLVARALADLNPRPEVVRLVRRARVAGVRCELDELFDAVVISEQVGLRKPSTAIYELTASKIGLPPDDCLFVDDTEANLPPGCWAVRPIGHAALPYALMARDRDRIADGSQSAENLFQRG